VKPPFVEPPFVKLPFVKLHGCANDYVLVDGAAHEVADPAALARASADRRTGVGSDGLLLVLPPQDPARAQARMRMFNPDGSESEMCGNGLRCLGKFLFDRRRVGRDFRVETMAGPCALRVETTAPDGRAAELSVEIGVPTFTRASDERFDLANRSLRLSALTLGNPHAVVFVDDVDHFPVASVGPAIERDARFPERTNVAFVQVVGPDELRQRTWERGVGETLACGSGATAAAIIARKVKGFGPDVRLHLRGGDLEVHWDGDGSAARLRGPAVEVFEGVLELA
jgi:diaminopimelate epimerase